MHSDRHLCSDLSTIVTITVTDTKFMVAHLKTKDQEYGIHKTHFVSLYVCSKNVLASHHK